MPAFFVHIHLWRFEIIQLLPDWCLVFLGEPSPRLVSPPVVIMTRCHFDIVIEFDDLRNEKEKKVDVVDIIDISPGGWSWQITYLSILQLIHWRPKTKFSQQVPFLFLSILPHLLTSIFCKRQQQQTGCSWEWGPRQTYHDQKKGEGGKQLDCDYLLFRMFLSSNSSAVGRNDSLRISLAPITDLSIRLSSSDTTWRILRSISSWRPGLWANLMAKESFRASLAANRSGSETGHIRSN